MTCCQIAAGCGTPVTGCTGGTVAAGHVLVDLQTTQMPIYVDVCKGDIYYWDGTKWIITGKDTKALAYDSTTRMLVLNPDNSAVQLPLASASTAGLVKASASSPITISSDGVLQVDCAKLKAQCNLLDEAVAPAGNVIYYNSITNTLDVDCAKLKTKCGLLDKTNVPSTNVIYYDNATGFLAIDCNKLKQNCGLASSTDLPISGPVVKINAGSKQLELDCAALKAQCNLASMSDIPAIPEAPTYNFAQQASLNGTTLHIANAQAPGQGVDVDLSSLIPSGGGGTPAVGGMYYDIIAGTSSDNNAFPVINRTSTTKVVTAYFMQLFGNNAQTVTAPGYADPGSFVEVEPKLYKLTRTLAAGDIATFGFAGSGLPGITTHWWVSYPIGVQVPVLADAI